MLGLLRSGDWLTIDRLTVYPRLLLAAFIIGFVALFATSTNRIDAYGQPLGSDFSQVWIAGAEVRAGAPDAPFDPARHFAAQRREFGPQTPLYGWHYPPYFLAIAALTATLPYLPALLLWQLLSLPLYLAAVFAPLHDARPPKGAVLVAALAFPAVAVNIAHGHNGFLSAGLLAGGCWLLPRFPLAAGAAFALLAYKPHFGIVVPIALVAGGCWRAIAAACATLALMTLASIAAFGLTAWSAFLDSLPFTRLVLEEGGPGFDKIQSVFAAVRLLGGSVRLAYLAQGAVSLAVIAGLALIWRSQADFRAKTAALLIAALLTTPYGFDYDMALLGPAVAAIASLGLQRGFISYEKTLLALVWIMPLLARMASGALLLPFGTLTMLAFFVMVLRRRNDADDSSLIHAPELEAIR